MKKADIIEALVKVRVAKAQWAVAQTKFNSDVEAIMTRLLHEAAVARMSDTEVANASGFTVKRIRMIMRVIGLNPRDGKNLLSAKAAEALANNATLLGIEPSEMDLMSPLAYLPMGEQMKRELQEKTVSQVTEVSGNFYERLADTIYNAMPWEGETYQAAAESIASAVLAELGLCQCGAGMPCVDCGIGL